MFFKNRRDAGVKLADLLSEYADQDESIVLGLPRGGVPVAYEVAKRLNVPLDVFLVRKLGVPGREELAMGAIASGGITILNEEVIRVLKIPDQLVQSEILLESEELERREKAYRGNKPFPELKGKNIILIDDGPATGASMKAAVKALKTIDNSKIIVAVPTAPPETCAEFEDIADEVICAIKPHRFDGVGTWYEDFLQTSDEEVKQLLEEYENKGVADA